MLQFVTRWTPPVVLTIGALAVMFAGDSERWSAETLAIVQFVAGMAAVLSMQIAMREK